MISFPSLRILRFMAITPSTGIDLYSWEARWLNGFYEGKSGPKISMRAFEEMRDKGLIKLAERCRQGASEGWYFITPKGRKACQKFCQ